MSCDCFACMSKGPRRDTFLDAIDRNVGRVPAAPKPWNDYPIGTRAYALNGGHWERVEHGWKWLNGDTFPTPGADWFRIELPKETIK